MPKSTRLRNANPHVTPSTAAAGNGSRSTSAWTRGAPLRSAASIPKDKSTEKVLSISKTVMKRKTEQGKVVELKRVKD